MDDSYSIYNNFFAVVNKRWVSNEICKSPWTGADVSYAHHLGMANGINSSTGNYPGKREMIFWNINFPNQGTVFNDRSHGEIGAFCVEIK